METLFLGIVGQWVIQFSGEAERPEVMVHIDKPERAY